MKLKHALLTALVLLLPTEVVAQCTGQSSGGRLCANPNGTTGLPAFTANPILGIAGTAVGSIGFRNATSGSITLQPTTGALGTVVLTLPATSGTIQVGAGAAIPVIAQGDLLYGSAVNTLSALAKNTSATRYLSNTGSSNNPAWAQIDMTNGVTGTLQAAQEPAHTGDVTNSAGSLALTLATVNANTGAWGSATQAPQFTVNGKGLITAAANVTITPAVGSITGLGTGVATALGINIGSAGAPVTFNGAGGTPSSLTLTNATGLPIAGIASLGTGVGTALAINIGSAGAPVTFNGALGTPSSGTLTNTTGFPVANLAGTTLPAAVVSSSLTSVGTIGTGVWSGTNIALNKGGTNAALTASNGGIVYSTATAFAVLAGTVTANQCLLSGSSAAPTWGSCSGGGAAVSSVADSGAGTLTISPTTGSVLASLNLAHANTWTALQTFGTGSPDTGIGIASTGIVANMFNGTSVSPTSNLNPSVYIWRTESITGSLNGYTGALTVGATGQSVIGTHQTQAITALAAKDGSSTGGDVNAVGGTAYHYGSNGAAFGGFFAGVNVNSAWSFGIETQTTNGSGTTYPYSPTPGFSPIAVGLDLNYSGSLGGSTQANGSAAILIRADNGSWDVGIGFMNSGSTATADIQTDSNATHILYAHAGSHTNGINLAAVTMSSKAFSSPGFSIDGGTGGGSLATDTGMTLSDGTRSGFLRPSFSASGFVLGTSTNHDVIIAPNQVVTFRVPSSGIASLSGSAPKLQLTNTGFTVLSSIMDDTTSFLVNSDATLAHGVYLPHGTSTWNSFSDARATYKKTAREVNELPSLDGFYIYENQTDSGHMETFVKAQELYRLFPNFVKVGDNDQNYEPTGMSDQRAWGVSYERTGIVALAYVKKQDAAIKQLSSENEKLRKCQATWKCRIFGIQ